MTELRFRLLEVDLSAETTRTVDVTEEVRSYLGGRGLGAKILWDRVPRGTDPLSPDNVLHIGIGPLTGLLGSVTCVSAKSPLTQLRGLSNMNGHFGVELVYAGYNAGILVTGKARRPVYLFIDDDTVEIRDATHLWGKSGLEAQQELTRQLQSDDPEARNHRFALIGPAGENRVRNADICHDLYHHAARLGMGAVMGAKKLKAIAVKGNRDPGYIRPKEAFAQIQHVFHHPAMARYKAEFRRWGHTSSMPKRYYATTEGVKNKQLGWDSVCELINPVVLEQEYKVWNDSCHGCAVGCKVPYLRREEPLGPCAGEMRHDNAGGWSANALIAGYEPQSYLSSYVDYLGLDGEDVSGVVTWMMECYQRGVVSKEDLGGIDLTWGNLEATCALLKKIAYREGIGDALAEGLKYAPERIGLNSGDYAMTGKGVAITSYEPRGSMGDALGLAVTSVGELHGGRGTPERIMFDSLTTCSFLRRPLQEIVGGIAGWAVPMLNATCGWDLTEEDWDRLTLRASTLERCYSLREGYVPARDDELPGRFFTETIHSKYGDPKILDHKEFLDRRQELYRSYGLRDDGTPSAEFLEELGLGFTIPEVEQAVARNGKI